MDILNSVKYVFDLMKYNFNVNRNDLIDPLIVMSRLAILSCKSSGTKVSIQNNKLSIQESSFVQGTIRALYGDKKNDINILIGPIIYACINYLSKANKSTYVVLFRMASAGIEKLKDTYMGKDIIYNIEQIKNIIDTFIANDNIEPGSFVANYNSQSYKLKTDIYKHISTVWTKNRLEILFNLINELNDSANQQKNDIIVSLNSFLDFVDNKVSEIIV
jgi:hypothetical protein